MSKKKIHELLEELTALVEASDDDEDEDEDDGDLPLDSEGEPIGVTQAAAEAFERWFEGSRVTDADDRPLVVYHASNAKFDVFEAGEFGFHFGTKEASSQFGSNSYQCYLRIENPLYINRDLGDWKPEAMLKALVEALNHHGRITQSGDVTRPDRAAALKDVRKLRLKHKDDLAQDDDMFRHSKAVYITGESVRKLYEKHGYDGVAYKNEGEGGTSWIALRPNQVKRVDNETFNPKSPKMHERLNLRAL